MSRVRGLFEVGMGDVSGRGRLVAQSTVQKGVIRVDSRYV
jgi:hypothetical protein